MNITGDKLIELLYLQMTDEKIATTLDALNIEQPQVTEQYEIDGDISILDSDNSGLNFSFEEIEQYSLNGEPSLVIINITNDKIISFPYNLKSDDDYKTCCEKLGKKADYKNKKIKNNRSWIFNKTENNEYIVTLRFNNSDIKLLKEVIIATHDSNNINKNYIPNEE